MLGDSHLAHIMTYLLTTYDIPEPCFRVCGVKLMPQLTSICQTHENQFYASEPGLHVDFIHTVHDCTGFRHTGTKQDMYNAG